LYKNFYNLNAYQDWSYVYKPPITSTVIASSKYAPLQNIPIQQTLPSDCLYKQSLPNTLTNNIVHQIQGISKPQINALQLKSTSNHYNHVTPHKQNSSNQTNYMPHPQQMTRLITPSQPSSNFQYSQMPGLNNRMRPNMSPVHMTQYQQMPSTNGVQHLHHMHGSHASQSQQSIYMTVDGSHGSQQTSSSLPPYHPNYSVDNGLNGAQHNFYPSYAANHRSPHPSTSPLPAMPFNIQSQQNAYLARNNLSDSSAAPLLPEAHSLVVNLLLSDSMLNLFKDHNFESCSICVCNMNIKGNDVGVYLPDSLVPGGYDEAQYRCMCGFSAVTNRHRSHYAGLFYEDEVEITGVLYDPCDGLKKKILAMIESNGCNDVGKDVRESPLECDQTIIDLLITQCTNTFSSCSVLSKAVQFDIINDRLNNYFNCESISQNKNSENKTKFRNPLSLTFKDGSEITFNALSTAKMSNDSMGNKHLMVQHSDEHMLNKHVLHEWPYKTTKIPVNNQEVIRLLKQLQPLMQESVQRKKTKMWEVTYTVSGPLTWRQFHRLAGRGTEDQCEPQPIPSLLVGYDKDCVALSPFALKYWEKLSLEPYSVTRDIAYIVVSPENDYILSHVKTFFKELSTTYEMLRLGKHCPIAKVLRDGILRVGTRTAKKLADEPIDEWFNQIGDGNVATKLKMYSQACRWHLAPLLSTQTLDKSLFESNQTKQSVESTNASTGNNSTGVGGLNNSSTNKPSNASPMPTNDSNSNEKTNDENQNESSSQHQSQQQPAPPPAQQETDQDEDPHKQPAIVIYIIEPFTFGSNDKDLYRLSNVGLLRCYSQILRYLPDNLKNSIHLQLISLDSLLCNGKDSNVTSRQDQLKELAFSVFSQCRQQLVHQSTVKSLTGFGPAAMYDMFLKSKDPAYNISRILTPPFILAPLKDKQTELGEMFGDRREKSQILYCCYCLTEDQRWLLASCTNDKGDILETKCINIEIPNRTRRRKASVRRFGLDKLMRFIQTVMSDSVQPWRLVIGRLGRVGHGELKDWTFLLSKKSLLKYSRQLKDMCKQCSYMSPFDQPAIFSACLISLEADTALRVFPDHYTPDERFSSSCNTCSLSTPEDASCTHILVFPTSATTQSSHASFSIDPLGANLGEDDLLQALDDPDLRVEDDINVNDIFQWTESPPQSPGLGSPRRDGLSQPDSPGNRQAGYGGSGSMKVRINRSQIFHTFIYTFFSTNRHQICSELICRTNRLNFFNNLWLWLSMSRPLERDRCRVGSGLHVLIWKILVLYFLRYLLII
jgi:mediator of RNA polymerase II transcription subunit 13